jgi:hypothetical protein
LQVVDLQLISTGIFMDEYLYIKEGSLFGYVKISQTMAHHLFAHEIVEKAWTNMDALKGVS